MNLLDGFKDPKLCRNVLRQIEAEVDGQFRFMEVCGTHTVAIFQSGLRSILPDTIIHVSGPGCPVCVTHEREVAAYLELAEKDVIITTFGDLMRVPGPDKRNLKDAQAEGARIKVVYSAFDGLKVAMENPQDKVVFLGIGFETTAPTVAATLKLAKEQGINNFYVLSFHKLVPPALRALVDDKETKVQGFLLPGHVSTVIGLEPYRFLAEEYNIPSVIGGFEPLDILQAILIMLRQKNNSEAKVINNYKRVVADIGNPKAKQVMDEVFEITDASWRGIGTIPQSGLGLNKDYEQFDAFKALDITLPDVPPIAGCKCGDVLKGKIRSDECPLFKKACTPASPVGPCMVSTEGSCAAYFKYMV